MTRKSDYELTEPEAALLFTAMQQACADAGALGGSLANSFNGGFGGRKGGAAGGRFGARFTRPRSAETSLEVAHPPEAAREIVTASIAEHGDLTADPNAAGDGSIWGLVDSGALDMVPALVRVQVEATGTSGSRVHVRATGREGLIKQKIAAKAVERIARALAQPR